MYDFSQLWRKIDWILRVFMTSLLRVVVVVGFFAQCLNGRRMYKVIPRPFGWIPPYCWLRIKVGFLSTDRDQYERSNSFTGRYLAGMYLLIIAEERYIDYHHNIVFTVKENPGHLLHTACTYDNRFDCNLRVTITYAWEVGNSHKMEKKLYYWRPLQSQTYISWF